MRGNNNNRRKNNDKKEKNVHGGRSFVTSGKKNKNHDKKHWFISHELIELN